MDEVEKFLEEYGALADKTINDKTLSEEEKVEVLKKVLKNLTKFETVLFNIQEKTDTGNKISDEDSITKELNNE